MPQLSTTAQEATNPPPSNLSATQSVAVSGVSPYAKYITIRLVYQGIGISSGSPDSILLNQVTTSDSQPSKPFSMAGWTLKSRDSEFSYKIPDLIYLDIVGAKGAATTTSVSDAITIYPYGASDVSIYKGGSPAKNYIRESELVFYTLYTGGIKTAWPEHDTLDLFDAQGLLVASLAY